MFSLGLLILALYNSPHVSVLQANSSVTTYKRLFSSSTTIPSASNSFLCSKPLPKELISLVLPRLITRRPAQRMTAKEFQQSAYFDNILISTIRFLDELPAKTPNEKVRILTFSSVPSQSRMFWEYLLLRYTRGIACLQRMLLPRQSFYFLKFPEMVN